MIGCAISTSQQARDSDIVDKLRISSPTRSARKIPSKSLHLEATVFEVDDFV